MTLSQYTHQYHAASITHGDVHHGSHSLVDDMQIFVAVYGVCQQAAQPMASIEPYDTCKQGCKWLVQPAASLRHRWLCNVWCPITSETECVHLQDWHKFHGTWCCLLSAIALVAHEDPLYSFCCTSTLCTLGLCYGYGIIMCEPATHQARSYCTDPLSSVLVLVDIS